MIRLKKTNLVRRDYCTLPLLTIVSIWICMGCSVSENSENQTSIDLEQDQFPEKVTIDHSIGYDLIYHNYWKELHLYRHYNDVVDTVKFALVQKGAPQPEGYADIRSIEIPVQNLATVSTTHLGMFEKLNALDHLKAIEAAKYVSSSTIRDQVAQGEITELAPSGMLNPELALANGVEVLLGVGFPNSQNESYRTLENAGVPVVLNADWQEKSLLGRAEWIKLVAALLNKEAVANRIFQEIEAEYNAVLSTLDQVEEGPLTITGLAQGDAWYVAGAKSFAYELLKLAKVQYPWTNNDKTGSLRLDFETVYEQGLKADYWMVPSTAKTKAEILAADPRFKDFKSYQLGNIFNIYGRNTPEGGNDFYESAVVNPHVVLKDIIKIFHPELLPAHELVYYNRLK